MTDDRALASRTGSPSWDSRMRGSRRSVTSATDPERELGTSDRKYSEVLWKGVPMAGVGGSRGHAGAGVFVRG